MKIINWLLIAFRKRMHWCRPTCIMRTCGVRLLFNIQYVMSSQSQRYVELCYVLLRYKVQTERTKRGSTLELLPILFCRCIGSPMTAKKSTSIHSIIGLLSPEQHRYLPTLSIGSPILTCVWISCSLSCAILTWNEVTPLHRREGRQNAKYPKYSRWLTDEIH